VSLLFFLSFALTARYLQDPRDDGLRLIWFLMLVVHGVLALKDIWPFSIVRDLLERQTEREAERLRARGYTVNASPADLALAGKEKRKRAARLSDDGEIEYEDEAHEDLPVRRSRASE
jgi:hypothetical protein